MDAPTPVSDRLSSSLQQIGRRSFLSPLAVGFALSVSCAQNPGMVVFFKPNSASLDDAAREIIQQAGAAARANPSAPVRVVGFASPETGTVEANKALAQARAQTVADALVGVGVAPGLIRVEPWGARSYGLTPTESHRVEIIL